MFCLKYYTIYNHQNLLVKAESTKTESRRLFTKNNQFALDYTSNVTDTHLKLKMKLANMLFLSLLDLA